MIGKQQLMDKLAESLEDNPDVKAVTGAFAELEREQREAIREHLEALGIEDDRLPELPDHEERTGQMMDALAVRLQSHRGPWDLYADNFAPEALETDLAEQYAGLEADEWADVREGWVAAYRDRGVADTFTDEELVEHYVRDTFGVDLETFEAEVVGFDAGEAFETCIAGPFQTNTMALEEATEIVADLPGGASADEDQEEAPADE